MNSYTKINLVTVARKLKNNCTIILIAMMTALMVTPAFAVSKTTTLLVSNMTCSACPITVKKALFGVRGVEKVTINLDKKEAFVTFDDAKTDVRALAKATEDAGYPSQIVGMHK
jgi:mercuric ion binding protein